MMLGELNAKKTSYLQSNRPNFIEADVRERFSARMNYIPTNIETRPHAYLYSPFVVTYKEDLVFLSHQKKLFISMSNEIR